MLGRPSAPARAATLARCRTAPRRTSSDEGNTRANISLHQCTSAGAERKLRRNSSGCRRTCPEPAAAHGGEAAHLGIAKPVDGLHRIADQEQRAAIALGPVLREREQQFVLIARGVLEFVDQDVTDARAEPFGQRGRHRVFGQRTARSAGHLGVIALALLVEDARQLRGGHHQQLRQCVERAARTRRYHRVRQRADDLERDDVARVEQGQPFGEGNTQRLGIRVFRRESLGAIEPGTNSAFLRERQIAQRAPARQVFDARPPACVCDPASWADHLPRCRRGVAGPCARPRWPARRNPAARRARRPRDLRARWPAGSVRCAAPTPRRTAAAD